MRSSSIFIPNEWRSVSKPDAFLRTDGQNCLTGNMNANNFKIENVGAAVFANDAVSKAWLEHNTFNKNEIEILIETYNFLKTAESGNLDMKNGRITNLATPVEPFDAVNKKYVDKILLSCNGSVDVERERKLQFGNVKSNSANIVAGGNSIKFTEDTVIKGELWLRLIENTATSFSLDFGKDLAVSFSKYFTYDNVNLESSNEYISFIEEIPKNTIFSIIVAANRSVKVDYYLQLSKVQ